METCVGEPGKLRAREPRDTECGQNRSRITRINRNRFSRRQLAPTFPELYFFTPECSGNTRPRTRARDDGIDATADLLKLGVFNLGLVQAFDLRIFAHIMLRCVAHRYSPCPLVSSVSDSFQPDRISACRNPVST